VIYPTFDVFAGTPDNRPLWLDSAATLEAACELMRERAQGNPGQYFVYSFASHSVMAQADTRPSKVLSQDQTGPAETIETPSHRVPD